MVSKGRNGVQVEVTDEAELAAHYERVAIAPMIEAIAAAQRAREAKTSAAIAAGLTIDGVTYSIDKDSQENWQKLNSTLRAAIAESVPGITLSTQRYIFDINSAPVQKTVAEILAIIAAIAVYAMDIEIRDLKWQGAIAAAKTVEAAQAIQVAIFRLPHDCVGYKRTRVAVSPLVAS